MTGGNNFYNREHTWPKSYGFPSNGDTNYPYTDMHHLFLADSGYNSDRSNKPYDDCNSGCIEDVTVANNGRGGGATDSNWTLGDFSAGSWETWDSRKGDVARALMYMDVRYEGGTHGISGASEPDLILTNDRVLIENSFTGGNEMVAYMGILSTLISWHKMDPVDDFERRHNDAVYAFQTNRNPFVDHPDYVSCVFEGVCNGGGADTTAPISPASLVASGGSLKIDLSWSANSETDLAGYKVYRRDVAGGATTTLTEFPIAATSYSDSGLTAATSYFYLVSAVDLSGNESPLSGEVSATTDAAAPPPPPPASSGGGGSLGGFLLSILLITSIRRKTKA
ncbi:MAG: endonuclease [Enterobacterales bacterium]|nr:endonuclease [Enterobacterales bacterium]